MRIEALRFGGHREIGEPRWQLERIVRDSVRKMWYPVCGERGEIYDHYDALNVDLFNSMDSRRVTLQLRAHDAGLAFHCLFNEKDYYGIVLHDEPIFFHFQKNPMV